MMLLTFGSPQQLARLLAYHSRSCWRVKTENQQENPYFYVLTDYALSDQDISSLILAGEVFLEEGRYRLNIAFDDGPQSREGIVFRESRPIARALGLKPVTPGAFLELDSEQLRYVLTGDRGEIHIGVYSSITGERVSSATIIPPQGSWQVEQVITVFVDDTEAFIESYFGKNNTVQKRVADFDSTLEEIRFMLKRVRKGLPLR